MYNHLVEIFNIVLRIMCRNIFLIIFSISICTMFVEARVYCHDSNARPWIPLGYTCPVVCGGIRNAIDSLIMLDYKNTINEQLDGRQKLNNEVDYDYVYDIFLNGDYHKDLRKTYDPIPKKASKSKALFNKDLYNKQYEIKIIDKNVNNQNILRPDNAVNFIQYTSIFRRLRNVKDILRKSNNKRAFKFKINKIEGKCWYMEKFTEKLLLGIIGYRPCTRKSNFDGKFVQIMTNILNKYTDYFKFTEEMTEILLENVFSSNTDLRNNILDVKKLLKYLHMSVDLYNNQSHGSVVTLKSKHCLTLAMPGCFCKSGYVEDAGQCVQPSDCVSKNYERYLLPLRLLILRRARHPRQFKLVRMSVN